MANNNKKLVEGGIVKLAVENFMSYDKVEFTPSAGLNVIMGPNATGKSTLVNAICLIMGGKPNMLGRGNQIASFINHDKKESATIQVEIYRENQQNTQIQRRFFKNNTSLWLLNNRPAKLPEIQALMKELNIQVDNLCQFLPQEKVGDFVKMSPQALLFSTEAVIDPNLCTLHEELKGGREAGKALESKCVSTTADLEKERSRNAALNADVNAFELKQQFEETIGKLKKKRPIVELRNASATLDREKAVWDIASQEVKKAERELTPKSAIVGGYRTEGATVAAKITKLAQKQSKVQRSASQLKASIEDLDRKTSNLSVDRRALQEREKNRQDKIHRIEAQLEGIEAQLNSQDSSHNFEPDIQRLLREMNEKVREKSTLEDEVAEIKQAVNRLAERKFELVSQRAKMENVENQKMERLMSRDRDTYNAVKWLRENHDRFKCPIYEPAALTLNVLDSNVNAKFVEAAIPMGEMRRFICTDFDDHELFYKECKEKRNWKIDTGMLPKDDSRTYGPPIQHIRKFGFTSYLTDLVEGPAPVLSYLCVNVRLSEIPVGGPKVETMVQQIYDEQPQLSDFFGPMNRFTSKRSKYGNRNVSTKITPIRDASIFGHYVDKNAEESLASKIKECSEEIGAEEGKQKAVERKIKALEAEKGELRTELQKFRELKNSKQKLETQHKTKTRQLTAEQEVGDVGEQLTQIDEQVRQLNSMKTEPITEILSLQKEICGMQKEKIGHCVRHMLLMKKVLEMEKSMESDRQNIAALQRRMGEAKATALEAKERVKSARRKVERQLEDGQTMESVQDLYPDLPDTVEQIDASIDTAEQRITHLCPADPQVIAEYEQRKKRIHELELRLTRETRQRDEQREKMTNVRTSWIEPVRALLERINENFRLFFEKLGCVGEVVLSVPPKEEDYAEYGATIMVKFEDDAPLKPLTMWQSGGERSVSTIVYMLSLQELSKAPFRCVDEINQGMDARNERMIFDLMISAAARDNSPQYFLLTPKLLFKLNYQRAMNMVCVNKGSYIDRKFDVGKYIARQKRLRHRKRK